MNTMTKMAIVGASILTMGALSACQSTSSTQDKERPHRMMKDHDGKAERKMSPEQREKFAQARAEQREVMKQMQTVCDNKAVNSAVQVKAGEKTIDGTCVMTFKPEMKKLNKKQFKDHQPMRGDMKAPIQMKRGEALTNAQRAEMVKAFDQKLAERQAKQKAIAQACQGKKDGSTVQIKAGTQTLNGTCEVRFQPNLPAKTMKKVA